MSDGGERDLRKYSRRAAIGLMGVGGGLAATETLGFTNVTADRGTTLRFADDDEAAFRIIANDANDEDEPIQEGGDTDKKTFDENLELKFENQLGADIKEGDLEIRIQNTDDDTAVTEEDNTGFNKSSGDFPLEGSDDNSATFESSKSISSGESLSIEIGTQDNNKIEDVELEVVRVETKNQEAILTNLIRVFDLDGTD